MKIFLTFLIFPTVFSCDSSVCKEAKQLLKNIWKLNASDNAKDQFGDYFTTDFKFSYCDFTNFTKDEFFALVKTILPNVPKVLNVSIENYTFQKLITFEIYYDPEYKFSLKAKEVDGNLKLYGGQLITYEELANIQTTCDSADCKESKQVLQNLWQLKNTPQPHESLDEIFTFDFKFLICDDQSNDFLNKKEFFQYYVAHDYNVPRVFNATSYTLKKIDILPLDPGQKDQQIPDFYEADQKAKIFFSKNSYGQYFHLKAKEVDGVFKLYEGDCFTKVCWINFEK